MAQKWSDIRADHERRLDEHPDGAASREQARDDLRAELEAHAFTLSELRRAHALTQVQLAGALEVSQAQVSRIEKQADLLLSTLASYVEAMGGELELVATFPDHPPVHLSIGEVIGTGGRRVENERSRYPVEELIAGSGRVVRGMHRIVPPETSREVDVE